MSTEWPTKQIDLSYAESVLKKHMDFNDGEPLGLFEITNKEEIPSDMRVADWVIELLDHYQAKYGKDHGDVITRKVVSSCLTKGHTVH